MLRSPDSSHWSEQFAQERPRLLEALGELTEGGVVESIQHIGATAVPALPAMPCVDIGLAVWPFPLDQQRQSVLETIGYHRIPECEGPPEQRFQHQAGTFRLFVVEAGSEQWTNDLLIRDYLAHNLQGHRMLSERKQAWADLAAAEPDRYERAKAQWFIDILEAARPWWVHYHGFGPVREVADELQGFPPTWAIAGGWAVDLFLGRVSRVHQDVDVVVARSDQLALQQHLTGRGWKLLTPYEQRLEPWPAHMRLELPRHQVHAHRQGVFIDFLLSDIGGGIWRYRRNPAVIRAVERMSLRSEEGIPFLAPELVALFKSQNTSGRERSKDQADFDQIRPHLEAERRAWLHWALLVTDPEHGWIGQLV